jgi:hypothetical protein
MEKKDLLFPLDFLKITTKGLLKKRENTPIIQNISKGAV